MRAIVLSSYPLVDRFAHKERVLRDLCDRGIETYLLYAGTAPADYVREARRRRPLLELRGRLSMAGRSQRGPSEGGPRARKLAHVARDLGIRVVEVRALGDAECLRTVSTFHPDVLFNLSALYVPKVFLDAADHRVVGGHYADLPRLRGTDTVRWTILLDHPMVVSHQVLTAEFDMGDIVRRTPVEVRRGDDIATIRRRCRTAAAEGCLAVADALASGELLHERQRREDGTTFFRMGTYLRKRVDEILLLGRYTHVAPGTPQ
jgi:folate-dependent phosphoribosylglycinamide formyltransferase PurN